MQGRARRAVHKKTAAPRRIDGERQPWGSVRGRSQGHCPNEAADVPGPCVAREVSRCALSTRHEHPGLVVGCVNGWSVDSPFLTLEKTGIARGDARPSGDVRDGRTRVESAAQPSGTVTLRH